MYYWFSEPCRRAWGARVVSPPAVPLSAQTPRTSSRFLMIERGTYLLFPAFKFSAAGVSLRSTVRCEIGWLVAQLSPAVVAARISVIVIKLESTSRSAVSRTCAQPFAIQRKIASPFDTNISVKLYPLRCHTRWRRIPFVRHGSSTLFCCRSSLAVPLQQGSWEFDGYTWVPEACRRSVQHRESALRLGDLFKPSAPVEHIVTAIWVTFK